MKSTLAGRQRSVPLAFAVVIALVAGLLAFTVERGSAHAQGVLGHDHAGLATTTSTSNGLPTASEVTLHDQMRKLWEDHVTWTRLAIVEFAAGTAGFNATATRLLQNQTDIGNAIAPFYGQAAGNQLTSLLDTHINLAVQILQDAKAGNTTQLAADEASWYDNANQIADFLSAANPKNWPDATMRDEMKVHLDETLQEAEDELAGNYTASVNDYEPVVEHMLGFADILSSGIIRQFPSDFDN